MTRGYYVVATAGGTVGFLAGPFPTVQEAWAKRGLALAALVTKFPKAKLNSSGVGYIEGEGAELPPGTLNAELGARYWTDAAGGLHCSHGVILYGTQCVICEREAI
jgi:hypothetical protein